MKKSVLKVENLSVHYKTDSDKVLAVESVSFSLEEGSCLGIIGESGSGKTSAAMAIMGLLSKKAEISGQVCYCDRELGGLSEQEWQQYRWNKIAMVFQNGLDVLNPVLTVQEQIYECLRRHTELSKQEAKDRVAGLLEMTGLDPEWGKRYPHQLSGGMRQRVLIAMALSCDPEVLLVDEPTSALDAVAKDEIITLLAKLNKERRLAMLVVSHEIPVIMKLTAKVAVMYAGHIVEEGITKDVIKNPQHPYTRGLLYSSPSLNPYRDLWGIPGETGSSRKEQCCFYGRCNQKLELCRIKAPLLEYIWVERKVACNQGGIVTLLQGQGICKNYEFKGERVKACANCEIKIRSGEIVALIGESGSGKTTLASILAGIGLPDEGEVQFLGNRVQGNNFTSRIKGIQMVFQDPFSAVNEHLTVGQAVREPLDILRVGSKEERRMAVLKALQDVQLPGDELFLDRRCHRLSGGQRQRVAIARSLVMEPKLLIADEISSMLDSSTQANVLRLLKGLQNSLGFSMLYVTHDLALARKIADRVYVMQRGRIIEHGTIADVFSSPKEKYTCKLVQRMT
ncbi:dipeptide ABC transporter ATP-binding protein [Desulfosporosinus shakirovi]|uniref:dipeptide ABC transporter ATP-binding protein n=1 Tax=Desulfosporosinus shakirovi TaxID=2885154 RepID=UPI001E2BBED2|nr:ABC transporter ATP-binding protein [Desulfosporosinus sp. SRJS8]MCB8817048.1 ABC transporter ATP-binding protein [Desulfosporosinus sp. SRJS8]